MQLNVHQFGSGTPGVLFLHGVSSAGPIWWRIGSALEAAGYSSAAPDLRGHGSSGHPDGHSLDAYARDVLESCPGPWRLVVGHSLGGATAVSAASMDPKFANAYLLIDPAIRLDERTAETIRTSITADVANPPTVEQLLTEHPQWSLGDADRKRASLLATSVEVIHQTFDHNRDWRLGEQLTAITAPVHILGADEDPLYTADDFARHAAGVSTLTFEQVPDTGHSIHRDDPETVIQRALEILNRWDRAAAE